MKQLTVYMADEIYFSIAKEAENEGLSISKFMLKLYLNRSLVGSIESSMQSSINRLGDTILAKLDMLQKPETETNSATSDALTKTEFREFNKLFARAVEHGLTIRMNAGEAGQVKAVFDKSQAILDNQ